MRTMQRIKNVICALKYDGVFQDVDAIRRVGLLAACALLLFGRDGRVEFQ